MFYGHHFVYILKFGTSWTVLIKNLILNIGFTSTNGWLMRGHFQSRAFIETLTSAGRVTNRVLAVWKNGHPDPAFAALETRTEYPSGTGVHIVTTDPRGVQTVTRAWQAGGADVTETASAGVTNRVTRYFGGATINERFWDGNWTRETRSESFNAQGCRVETVVTESSDYPVFTNSVTFYDFLGRVESVLTPAFGGGWITAANFYDGSSTRVVRSTSTGQPDTLYEYDALGNLRDIAVDVNDNGVIDYSGQDRISRSETSYTQSGSDWWRETASCVWSITNSAQCLTNSLSRMRMT
ncbi:MAG: hypothetical protein PHH65_08110, partial [Eubacteriales bacterium]|nr:hypothetical protein [Eubacteriales bacterium]